MLLLRESTSPDPICLPWLGQLSLAAEAAAAAETAAETAAAAAACAAGWVVQVPLLLVWAAWAAGPGDGAAGIALPKRCCPRDRAAAPLEQALLRWSWCPKSFLPHPAHSSTEGWEWGLAAAATKCGAAAAAAGAAAVEAGGEAEAAVDG